MKNIAVIFLLFTVSSTGFGQQKPWEDTFETARGTLYDISRKEWRSRTFYLTIDTLRRIEDSLAFLNGESIAGYWNKDSLPNIGYGYLDSAGIPLGIWKYYKLIKNEYQLYCEGYYLKPSISNLVPAKDVKEEVVFQKPEKVFDVKDEEFQKIAKTYFESIESKLMLTGEWRFYENGLIKKRLFFGDKCTVPTFTLASYDDKGAIASEKTILSYSPWRIAGDISAYEMYNSDGSIQSSVHVQGLSAEFKNGGKPILKPLPPGYYH